ncbi:6-phosphogluconolactonase [Maribacter sp. PR1]|uniref:6-phosphogluconolactonase n=1 Tax=Maribacter cobaltidurans TaxID=1178778 RepID=A0ABU7IVB5_9FLAO|nr:MULTISPECIES: 6-phosphogluconolactonase [Maribacter]MDC6389494.1 6-phosphogluconolactonase [Maribacter sp. PR1]MEE1976883.1 6-phosphogluconolactonase [Maribacter cobaltidurans]
MDIKIYKNKKEVAMEFSKYFIDFVGEREEIHIALSGGSTPKIVFDVLADTYGKEIDWNKIHLYWGDERCVSPTDDESNYKMTLEHLLSKIDIPEANIHRVLGENEPKDEAVRYSGVLEKQLPTSNEIPQFDLVILGMGDDGHTASIFPYEIHLWDSEKVCEVAIHPNSGQRRITITGKVINNAQEVAFLVTGEGKSEKVRIITQKEDGYIKYPASLVYPNSKKLVWFLDQAAASEIS